MDFNVISMFMDVKLDIYNKRPDSLKFKAWTKCQVKIEAIKCLPCFLRIHFHSIPDDDFEESAQLSVSINVPGVTISLATSRTKQHSYGLFWAHNRRNCFIYFSLDTEASCRKHMKWIKKSIKNLELYRQVFLEQRRNSRGPCLFGAADRKADKKKELRAVKDALIALGPLPQIPDANSSINWSRRVSRASDLYEEIFEGHLPTRLSHISIGSGIYEEMKPCSFNIHSIVEENINFSPPPLPPLPPHRKRVNTFDSDPLRMLGDIPRSNTNPETDVTKKKKHKNVLGNILGSRRTKRSASVSESPTSTIEDIIKNDASVKPLQPIYANEIVKQPSYLVKADKRNSFSSPNLSKINFLDTFDEAKLAKLLHFNSSVDLDAHADDDFDCDNMAAAHNKSSLSLDISSIVPRSSVLAMAKIHALQSKVCSMESLNVSSQLPQNFNFSACNTSSINLIGASGAVPSIKQSTRNKMIFEDELSGYCIMAPIVSKKVDSQATITATTTTASSTTSGYSTGSYYSPTSSSSSSNTHVTENKERKHEIFPKTQSAPEPSAPALMESQYDELPVRKAPLPVCKTDISNIYENVHGGSPLSGGKVLSESQENTPTFNKDFSGNLYENLLTIKAAQELEQSFPDHICTSTPTDSPGNVQPPSVSKELENFYQTPRKSIISVDDKVPSYYPNSCDTIKMKRYSKSPSRQATPSTTRAMEKEKSSINAMSPKNFANVKLKRERNENLYMSSPQKVLEQRKKADIFATKSRKSANAQKISENVYAVNLSNKKHLHSKNNTTEKSPYKAKTESGQIMEKQHSDLLQLAFLQKIDFKFDDTSNLATKSIANSTNEPERSGITKSEQAELEYENCYQASKDATKLLNKYATLGQNQFRRISHHLQVNQSSNQENLMTRSTKLESPVAMSTDLSSDSSGSMGSKNFASLPRFKKINFSPLKLKINNVLQRN